MMNSDTYRRFTIWSAGLLEQTLLVNDIRNKGPWETDEPNILIAKINKEYDEVKEACRDCCTEERRTPEALEHLKYELSDLAAACYMLAARLDPEMSQLKRGRL